MIAATARALSGGSTKRNSSNQLEEGRDRLVGGMVTISPLLAIITPAEDAVVALAAARPACRLFQLIAGQR